MSILKKVYHKTKLDVVWNRFASAVTRATWKPLRIMKASETINYIIDNKCSIARFGDGELHIVAYNSALRFQKTDKQLQKRLIEVLNNPNPDLLLCLPNRLNIVTESERKELSEFWQNALKLHLYSWTKHIQKKRLYGDTNLSRLTETDTYKSVNEYIEHIKMLWADRNVIMVEGEKTRFGVGNSLFDNVSTLRRILGPSTSAFDCYSELLEASVELAGKVESPLVLIALGPTATVLASDLADRGIQSLDLGHLDICYEQYKSGTNGPVAGKYTNEAVDGDNVGECLDEEYISQIAVQIQSK